MQWAMVLLVLFVQDADKKVFDLPKGKRITNFNFSPDGRIIYYGETIGGDWGPAQMKSTLVVDGKQVETAIHPPIFSEDGKHYAYPVGEYGNMRIVHDGKEGPVLHQVSRLVMSGDGKNLAYTAMKDRKWIIVVNGLESGPFFRVSNPVLSHDGTTVVYTVDKSGRDGDSFIVVNGKEGPMFSQVMWPAISKDGKVAYTGFKRPKWNVVVDEKTYGPFDRAHKVVWSADGKHFAFGAVENGKSVLFVDGIKTETEFQPGYDLHFTPKGELVYSGHKAGQAAAVVGDKVGPKYKRVLYTTMSAEGKLAYVATENGQDWFLVVDGKKTPAGRHPAAPTWGPEGKRLVFIESKDGKQVLNVDGRKSEAVDRISGKPVFKGNRVFFRARIGDELWWKSLKLD